MILCRVSKINFIHYLFICNTNLFYKITYIKLSGFQEQKHDKNHVKNSLSSIVAKMHKKRQPKRIVLIYLL